MKKVYSFNPIPKELNAEESKYILGAQANLWTEYIQNENQVEYMVFPRILALSEVTWNGPSQNLENDYPDFLSRVENFMERFDALEVNYANHLYEIEGNILKEEGKVFYELTTPTKGKEIHYSINNAKTEVYSKPILIEENAKIKAHVFKNGEKVGSDFSEEIKYHKGITAKISLNVPPNPAYAGGGKEALINGISGSDKRYGDKEWLGFWGDNLEITIDFGTPTDINSVTTRFYNAPGQWIHAPKIIKMIRPFVDGTTDTISIPTFSPDDNNENIIEGYIPIIPILAGKMIDGSKIVLIIPNYGIIPEGQQGAGNKAWTFIDEIIIE